MNLDWPEALGAFEDFLKGKGLVCECRGTVPRYKEKLALYGNDKIAVRVLSERGVWFADVADIAARPDEWYDAEILRYLVTGRDEALSIAEQLRAIEENWVAILDSFTPVHRDETHKRLEVLRKERSRRMFPGLLSQ
jgi:hypothetical protein